MGFLIKCNNCGSEDVTIPVSAGEKYSSLVTYVKVNPQFIVK
ncbi:hypothetical protein [Bacillus tequilensis]|nr:hypothetical protein [Bacillus tequilensis]SPU01146.1 Uncharacterised protein [Bacillus tequilensis]